MVSKESDVALAVSWNVLNANNITRAQQWYGQYLRNSEFSISDADMNFDEQVLNTVKFFINCKFNLSCMAADLAALHPVWQNIFKRETSPEKMTSMQLRQLCSKCKR
jgi:hypothetical protein